METEAWIESCLPKHSRLTQSVLSIAQSLLEGNGIEYLSVSGRTKEKEGVLEKIRRKNYADPPRQMTDISGVRIIVFIESDIERVANIIKDSFSVDAANSSNKGDVLSSNQVGYRSVHFVCDLGSKRAELPEFEGLCELKFEFQVRTVLQHAWAELAHDRSYKFRGELPDEIQRKLYLYAGLLEIADKGFSEIARDIDIYTNDVNELYSHGDLNVQINSISLVEFVEKWSKNEGYPLEAISPGIKAEMADLLRELKEFGIETIDDLSKLIPDRFAEYSRDNNYRTNIYGLVRTWMICRDVVKLRDLIGVNWILYEPGGKKKTEIYRRFSSPENFQAVQAYIEEDKKKIAVDDDDDDGGEGNGHEDWGSL